MFKVTMCACRKYQSPEYLNLDYSQKQITLNSFCILSFAFYTSEFPRPEILLFACWRGVDGFFFGGSIWKNWSTTSSSYILYKQRIDAEIIGTGELRYNGHFLSHRQFFPSSTEQITIRSFRTTAEVRLPPAPLIKLRRLLVPCSQ
jgi:hypothetical protein